MRRILVLTASRAEKGLLDPVMFELKNRGDIEAEWLELSQDDCIGNISQLICKFEDFKPNIVLCPCDRNEMVYMVAYTFHNGKIVCHFHAGDKGEGTSDEMNRYAISCLSHILLCNSEESRKNLLAMGFEDSRIFCVGTTALDNVEIDESLCPAVPYDLVLLHPDPVSMKATRLDVKYIIGTIKSSPFVVWIYPNKDKNHEIIENIIQRSSNLPHSSRNGIPLMQTYHGVSHAKFLGLLKNCARAIGNSSAFTYELPLVNSEAEYVKIGCRNKGRTPPSSMVGASKRIASILATIKINDDLRRKRFCF